VVLHKQHHLVKASKQQLVHCLIEQLHLPSTHTYNNTPVAAVQLLVVSCQLLLCNVHQQLQLQAMYCKQHTASAHKCANLAMQLHLFDCFIYSCSTSSSVWCVYTRACVCSCAACRCLLLLDHRCHCCYCAYTIQKLSRSRRASETNA
jgi:hypothetical protein